jgi:hypothetical protein
MRTSNKILIAAFVLLFTSLAFFDLSLKAEYQKGDYADPYRDFVKLDYKNFNAIELKSSTAINIMLVQGPFKVMATPQIMDALDISQEKNKLIIGAKFHDHFRGMNSDYILYVSCPTLTSLRADASYLADNVKITDTLVRDINWRPTMITGFTADSLNIREDHAANVILQNNTIKHLNATIGQDDNSGSALTMGSNNQFTTTDINVLNRSRLWIKGTNANNINYHLADSASLIVNGAAAKRLLNLK